MTTSRLLSLFFVSILAACGGGGSDAGGPTSGSPSPTPTPPAPYASCSTAGLAAASASTATDAVCMLTTQGEIVVELYADKAPVTVPNFMQYVNTGRFDNTLYHRVAKGFVIQGGGFTTANAAVATFPAIPLESNNGLSNLRGTIAMARTDVANSATSQFFFNLVDNSACLDRGSKLSGCDANGYAVFGKVISGMDVVDKIAIVAVNASVPVQPVVTYWAQRVK